MTVVILNSCTKMPNLPEPYGAIPSTAQLKWQKLEYFGLVCCRCWNKDHYWFKINGVINVRLVVQEYPFAEELECKV